MKEMIKNYLKEQMTSFDESKVLVLKNWVVLGMSKNNLRAGDAIALVMYDDKKRIVRTEPFFDNNDDIEETYVDICNYAENEFGIEF